MAAAVSLGVVAAPVLARGHHARSRQAKRHHRHHHHRRLAHPKSTHSITQPGWGQALSVSAGGIRVAGTPLDWNLLAISAPSPRGLLVSTSTSTAVYASPQLCSKRPGCSTSNGSSNGWFAVLGSYVVAKDHLYVQVGTTRGAAEAAAQSGNAVPATVIYDVG